jgi:radical SAM superfamily enzyme YgiQ (UPF0313 family)
MELYHNQVTREHGPFSLRMFHRSWGIMMIQKNISAPCTVLDFPLREDFAQELRDNDYDIVGISSIIPNVGKVKEMCRMAREISPKSTIVVGGHVAAIPGIESMIDADHIVRGEGIAWMRNFLGEDPNTPIKHPNIVSGFGTRSLGITQPTRKGAVAATLIPSVGCPMGCNFCTTSAFFGGKGKCLNFYESGKQLFDVMSEMETALHAQSFFVMDENFLLQRERAMQLLECMKKENKSWTFYVFSSANAIRKYTIEELVQIGVSWVWMGLESPRSSYSKLKGTDTVKLAHTLRSHGIKLLGSTIVGLEHHTPANIREEIEFAVSHETDFHQFMLYTPVPGTPLYQQVEQEGRLLQDTDLADIHGQFKFNFEHAAISRDDSKKFLDWAFWRDFERNGPSLYRICKTTLEGWKRYKDCPDLRVRERFQREAESLKSAYAATLWAMEKRFKETNANVSEQMRTLRRDIEHEFGMFSKMVSSFLGPVLLWTSKREEKRLAKGQTYEPPTIIERRNWVEA